MPHTLSVTKPMRIALRREKPFCVYFEWPPTVPKYRVMTFGKPYRSKEGRRLKTVAKHHSLVKLRKRVRLLKGKNATWMDAYDHLSLCGDVALDPDNLPAPHPSMDRYSWWRGHPIHEHPIYGRHTSIESPDDSPRGTVPTETE